MEAVVQLARPSARFMDLCSGLGIDSVVFVDIDALLLELLLERRIKWQATPAGGSPLQVFAALETFLADLMTCQEITLDRLHFLSFKVQALAWIQPSTQLLRLMVVEFFKSQGAVVHELHKWNSERFSRVLHNFNVAFLLTSDVGGSAVAKAAPRELQVLSNILAAQATYGSSSGQWNSAFLSQLGIVDGRAFGFRTLGRRPNKEIMAVAISVAEACSSSCTTITEEQTHWLPCSLTISLQTLGTNARAALGISACCRLLQTQTITLSFAKAWCLHESLLAELPLNFRALATNSASCIDELCLTQLSSLYTELARQIAGLTASHKQVVKQDWQQLCDLYDPCLLLLSAQLCKQSDLEGACLQKVLRGLPQAVPKTAFQLWQAIQRHAELAEADSRGAADIALQLHACLNPGLEHKGRSDEAHIAACSIIPDGQQKVAAPCQSAAEAQNVLIDSLREAAPAAAAAGMAALEVLKSSKQQQDMQATQQSFLEDYHWHSGKPLEPAIWTATEQTAIILSKYQSPSELLGCWMLRRKYKARIVEALRQCQDRLLVPNKAVADKHLADKCQEAIQYLREYTSREEALLSRALHLYASSLSNTSFINRTSSAAVQPAAKQKQTAKAHKKAAPLKGGADRIKEENRLRQVAKQQGKLQEQWLHLKQTFNKQNDWLAAGENAILKLLKEAASSGANHLFLEVSIFRAEAHLEAWRKSQAAISKQTYDHVKTSLAEQAIHHAATVWQIISGLWHGDSSGETGCLTGSGAEMQKQAAGCLASLGFQDAAKLLCSTTVRNPARPSSSRAASCACSQSIFRFQLEHCGHLLPRDPGTQDHRTASFNPDPWQQKVLDIIDQGASALICAPTSSGKTFISNYVICKVLAESNKGLCIFVAPTKALVNQVQAQVYADFKIVAGVFTRDFRSHVMDSRVLVTVPTCLEILLLSASQRNREWAANIQYVIFDEIHCLREGGLVDGGSQDSSGAVWEHLLTMIRCPFLALSATIGNPEQVHGWLKSLKDLQQSQDAARGDLLHDASASGQAQRKAAGSKAKGPTAYDVSFVSNRVRHADLRLYIYQPREEPHFSGITSLQAENRSSAAEWRADTRLLPIHPLAPIQLSHLQAAATFPFDLPFEPRDSLCLYTHLHTALEQAMSDVLVEPAWTSSAIEALNCLSPEAYFANASHQTITRSASRQYEAELKELLRLWASNGGAAIIEKVLKQLRPSEHKDSMHGHDPLMDGCHALMNLLVGLSKKDMLPAIIFNFNRAECECIGESLVDLLEELEGDEEGPLEQFSFLRTSECHLLEEAEAQIDKLTEYGDLDEDDYLIRGLRRGIGIHHSGLATKYRKVVEVLFRAKFLRLVVATGTLAYGINMPCRSVIFAGDNVFFDPLQYRQMMGRAGRRGFDTLGHVIFFGVPAVKRYSLMLSPVPRLSGNFPLTISLFMRAMVHQAQVPGDLVARDSLLRMFQRPMFAYGNPSAVAKMMHLCFYAQMYCQQLGLLTSDNKPIGLTGLVTHLFWTEPENLAFCSLLQNRVFHDICTSSNSWETIAQSLLVVLSHLFEREPLHWTLRKSRNRLNSPSKVVLERMDPKAEAALAKHNDSALQSISAYAMKALAGQAGDDIYALPFSGLTFAPGNQAEWSAAMHATHQGGSVLSFLSSHQVPSTICSPFAALSGMGDDFASPGELVRCVKPGLLLNANTIPPVRQVTRHGLPVALNRFVLDYWQHGQKQALVQANHMREGDAYSRLLGFKNVLRALAVAMEKLGSDTDPVTQSFSRLAEEFCTKFADFNRRQHFKKQ
ncbi:hypothetical protein WJX74_002273 [Apatococcus lobatus]|uniref:Uncharacterized protein n=1 Tax=Apatococcus lobatus TaxID=904363 RepID=A0AAW1REI3_9CHLO